MSKYHKLTSSRVTSDLSDYKPEVGSPNSVLVKKFSVDEFTHLVDRVKYKYLTWKCKSDKFIKVDKPAVLLSSINNVTYKISPTEFLTNINYWAAKLVEEYEVLRYKYGNEDFNKYIRNICGLKN